MSTDKQPTPKLNYASAVSGTRPTAAPTPLRGQPPPPNQGPGSPQQQQPANKVLPPPRTTSAPPEQSPSQHVAKASTFIPHSSSGGGGGGVGVVSPSLVRGGGGGVGQPLQQPTLQQPQPQQPLQPQQPSSPADGAQQLQARKPLVAGSASAPANPFTLASSSPTSGGSQQPQPTGQLPPNFSPSNRGASAGGPPLLPPQFAPQPYAPYQPAAQYGRPPGPFVVPPQPYPPYQQASVQFPSYAYKPTYPPAAQGALPPPVAAPSVGAVVAAPPPQPADPPPKPARKALQIINPADNKPVQLKAAALKADAPVFEPSGASASPQGKTNVAATASAALSVNTSPPGTPVSTETATASPAPATTTATTTTTTTTAAPIQRTVWKPPAEDLESPSKPIPNEVKAEQPAPTTGEVVKTTTSEPSEHAAAAAAVAPTTTTTTTTDTSNNSNHAAAAAADDWENVDNLAQEIEERIASSKQQSNVEDAGEEGEVRDFPNKVTAAKIEPIRYDEHSWNPLKEDANRKKKYTKDFLMQFRERFTDRPAHLDDKDLDIVEGAGARAAGENRNNINRDGSRDRSPGRRGGRGGGGVGNNNNNNNNNGNGNAGGPQGAQWEKGGRDRFGGPGGGGGSGRGGKFGKKEVPKHNGPPVEPLTRTDAGWKPEKADVSTEKGLRKALIKEAQGHLNKMTALTYDKLSQQILLIAQREPGNPQKNEPPLPGLLAGIIKKIFEQALMQPHFCPMYAKLCQKISSRGGDQFRRDLLNKCQEEFEGESILPPEDMPEEEKELFRYKAKKRVLGNIKFICELFKVGMLVENIMHECITRLLKQDPKNPDEEQAESLIDFMYEIGKNLERSGQSKMDGYFKKIEEMQKMFSSRIRFMLEDLCESRRGNWKTGKGKAVVRAKPDEKGNNNANNVANNNNNNNNANANANNASPTKEGPKGKGNSTPDRRGSGSSKGAQGDGWKEVSGKQQQKAGGGSAKQQTKDASKDRVASNVNNKGAAPTNVATRNTGANNPGAKTSPNPASRGSGRDNNVVVSPSATNATPTIAVNNNNNNVRRPNITSSPVSIPEVSAGPTYEDDVEDDLVSREGKSSAGGSIDYEQYAPAVVQAVDEYWDTQEAEGVAYAVEKDFPEDYRPRFVYEAIKHSLLKTDHQREQLADLFFSPELESMLTKEVLQQGLSVVVADLADWAMDHPAAPKKVGALIGRAMKDGCYTWTQLWGLFDAHIDEGRGFGLAADSLGSALKVAFDGNLDSLKRLVAQNGPVDITSKLQPRSRDAAQVAKFLEVFGLTTAFPVVTVPAAAAATAAAEPRVERLSAKRDDNRPRSGSSTSTTATATTTEVSTEQGSRSRTSSHPEANKGSTPSPSFPPDRRATQSGSAGSATASGSVGRSPIDAKSPPAGFPAERVKRLAEEVIGSDPIAMAVYRELKKEPHFPTRTADLNALMERVVHQVTSLTQGAPLAGRRDVARAVYLGFLEFLVSDREEYVYRKELPQDTLVAESKLIAHFVQKVLAHFGQVEGVGPADERLLFMAADVMDILGRVFNEHPGVEKAFVMRQLQYALAYKFLSRSDLDAVKNSGTAIATVAKRVLDVQAKQVEKK